jgi:hypothetical protein
MAKRTRSANKNSRVVSRVQGVRVLTETARRDVGQFSAFLTTNVSRQKSELILDVEDAYGSQVEVSLNGRQINTLMTVLSKHYESLLAQKQ